MAYKGYLVRGRFLVYDRDGQPVGGDENIIFLNKFFDIKFPGAVKEEVLKHIATRVHRNYGREATFAQIGDLKLVQKERQTKPRKKGGEIKKEEHPLLFR